MGKSNLGGIARELRVLFLCMDKRDAEHVRRELVDLLVIFRLLWLLGVFAPHVEVICGAYVHPLEQSFVCIGGLGSRRKHPGNRLERCDNLLMQQLVKLERRWRLADLSRALVLGSLVRGDAEIHPREDIHRDVLTGAIRKRIGRPEVEHQHANVEHQRDEHGNRATGVSEPAPQRWSGGYGNPSKVGATCFLFIVERPHCCHLSAAGLVSRDVPSRMP